MFESPFLKQMIKKFSSGTTVGTITIVKAKDYLIPLPPLAEQHRIVEKIEELIKYCDML
ncbi:MAG: restriction endonuclease subunit S [Ruminococcus sp.]|nr:restriction endonuclease subunit S [Ruminococcus sp.]